MLTQTRIKIPRTEIVRNLIVRDGLICMYPECGKPLDADAVGSKEITIDHWFPQLFGRENGWSYEQIWDLSNLKLMHKSCNAKKGHLIPNEDGTLPERKTSKFRHRREKRAERPEVCMSCNAGRDLGPDEICASCGSGAMPERFPRWAKVKSNECDHEAFWCWACSIGIVERVGATEMIMLAGEGGEE